MKKQEREHLKEDPFQLFIQNILDTLKKFKREIYIGIGVLVAVGLILAGILLFNMYTNSVENKLYSKVITIKNDDKLSVDQKIEKISKLEGKSGISASINIFLSSLYFEKGDMTKAKEVLDKAPSSSIDILNGQKSLLEADILAASQKYTEAIELLNKLFTDSNSEVSKDYILVKIAKIQIKSGQTDQAKATLNRVLDEFARSYYSFEAKQLLNELENK